MICCPLASQKTHQYFLIISVDTYFLQIISVK
ncbi:hypothetical protein NC651_023652 [Populus alba x Populus x berolinensis]|nr:hypothetical protein NC651_023652 [Populus alba x Populus x berolinensis]